MKEMLGRRIAGLVIFALVIVSAYFINVEVQTYYGKQALENTGLVSLPLEQALTTAKAENKQVLVDVSAIWCPTCRKLDREVFANEEVKKRINEKFIFSRLEYESGEGQKFLEQHQASGFPNLWILDADGKVIKRLPITFNFNEFLNQLN